MRMPKKAVNLSIDADLLAKARALDINLSATFEEVLRTRAREEERKRWVEENRDAIEAFNRRIERDGVWSDGLRRF
ncbi:Post-segregation antitoxin CcdA [Parvibaculum lavamentivorans DS-1]|uniref:Post-segregation antitoxin CcdA n=2 Tax=Parvibaculum lavamentivorans TaxID=256618 RepID=A7HPK7_PARL1|nr:Post-segregation antitoxin CcdA [Parvibaculum lavamentivorans DS-1]